MIAYPNIPKPAQAIQGYEASPTLQTEGRGLRYEESRSAVTRQELDLSWVLTGPQFQVFEDWFSETLSGGTLIFELPFHDGDTLEGKPFRFTDGVYSSYRDAGGYQHVSATVERMFLLDSNFNRTPPVPNWYRVTVDPALSQILTVSHRNSLLVLRPDFENLTTLRIPPPTDPSQWLPLGISNLGEGDTLITSADVDPPVATSTIYYPVELPGVENGLRDIGSRSVIRLDMAGGNTRQSSEHGTTVKTYQGSWLFTLSELKVFQEFFFIDLQAGTLPFVMGLPVEGQFLEVPVRFVGGGYREVYATQNAFRVTAQLERVVDQTVIPTTNRPYPLYYTPVVEVLGSTKLSLLDAGKLYVLDPPEGETVNLHISTHELEFGLLIIGLGNVLITRSPYALDIGTLEGQAGSGTFNKPTFELVPATVDIGTLEGQAGSGTFNKPTFELITVLVDIGTLEGQAGSGTFNKPTFELAIP